MIRTIDTQSWALQMNNLRFTTIYSEWDFDKNPRVIFEPSLPYVYIPDGDYVDVVMKLQEVFPDMHCSYQSGYCSSKSPCKKDLGIDIEFQLRDSDNEYQLSANDFMINGTHVGGTANQCFFTFFKYHAPG